MDEIAGLVESLTAELKKKFDELQQGPSLVDQVTAFVHAVDFTEPWIIGLISTHVLLLLVVLLTRKRQNFQLVLFLVGLVLVFLAEYINAWAASNWKLFSRQNYFDPNGFFASIMFSGPLLLICVVVLVNSFFNIMALMVQWKRAELKHRAKKRRVKAE